MIQNRSFQVLLKTTTKTRKTQYLPIMVLVIFLPKISTVVITIALKIFPSLVNNNANKGSQPSSDKPPNAPKESLVIDDLDKKNSLLKEINRIDNWANVASDNDCLIRHKTKIKIFSKISRRGLKMQEKDCMQMNYLKQIMKHPKIYIYIIKLSIASFKDGGLPMNMVDRCGFTWLDLW